MIFWVVIAVVFAGYALTFLWQLENEGVAINKAGSLRMRTYRMVSLIQQENNSEVLQKVREDFSTIIQELKDMPRRSLMLLDTKEIENQIMAIDREWQNDIKVLISNNIQAQKRTFNAADLMKIDRFVSQIDTFVSLIETQNTQRIDWIRFIQSLFILMVILLSFAGIYLLYCLIIRPLERLRSGLDELSRGNLSQRLPITSQDEFGIVTLGFNAMADNLQDLYTNLEEKVTEKTADLARKNHELSALYDMTAFLHEAHTLEIIAQAFLAKAIELSHADSGSIRLVDEQRQSLDYVHNQGLTEELLTSPQCCSLSGCRCGLWISQKQPNAAPPGIVNIDPEENTVCSAAGFCSICIFSICYNNKPLGIVTLYFREKRDTLPYEHLLQTLSGQLAIALENYQLAIRDRQLAVMEERNLIAQGLHDSIAQSLSFLNLQAQMLQNALNKKDEERVHETLDFIKKGIQESYEDVRELLLNFRTSVQKNTFRETLIVFLDRFKMQTQVNVQFLMPDQEPVLTSKQQTQVTFILQEILSNVRKHSACSMVSIMIEDKGDFKMHVHDNGRGFDAQEIQQKKLGHVGLAIMAERAAQISALLDIHSAYGEGTSVTLTIPKNHRGVL